MHLTEIFLKSTPPMPPTSPAYVQIVFWRLYNLAIGMFRKATQILKITMTGGSRSFAMTQQAEKQAGVMGTFKGTA